VGDDTGLPRIARIGLCVGGDDRFAGIHHLVSNRSADGELAAIERFLVEVTGHLHFEFAIIIQQHQKTAFGIS
jgi:hypothetical protein